MRTQKKFSIQKLSVLVAFIALVSLNACQDDPFIYIEKQDNNPPTAEFSYTISDFDVTLTNSSINATSYSWDFGDGKSSTEFSTSHTYTQKGTYTIKLVVKDNNDASDEFSMNVKVGFPHAAYSYVADKLSVTFTNSSSNATSYSWDFGDSTTSTEANPTHVFPEEGKYTVKLTAIDGSDEDSYSEEIFVVGKFIPTILNPSFDDPAGAKNDWEGTFSTTQGPTPPDGVNGAKLDKAGKSIAQTIEVGSNTDYILRFWTVTKSTTKGCKLTITDGTDNTIVIIDQNTGGTPDASNYVQRSINFSTGSSTSITLKIEYVDTESRFDMFEIQ